MTELEFVTPDLFVYEHINSKNVTNIIKRSDGIQFELHNTGVAKLILPDVYRIKHDKVGGSYVVKGNKRLSHIKEGRPVYFQSFVYNDVEKDNTYHQSITIGPLTAQKLANGGQFKVTTNADVVQLHMPMLSPMHSEGNSAFEIDINYQG